MHASVFSPVCDSVALLLVSSFILVEDSFAMIAATTVVLDGGSSWPKQSKTWYLTILTVQDGSIHTRRLGMLDLF